LDAAVTRGKSGISRLITVNKNLGSQEILASVTARMKLAS
jgi:hypothetical protein